MNCNRLVIVTLAIAIAPAVLAKPPLADKGIDVIPMPVKFDLKGGSIAAADVKPVCRRDASVPAEGYRLSVSSAGVQSVASSDAGEFYARQTLKQLPRE